MLVKVPNYTRSELLTPCLKENLSKVEAIAKESIKAAFRDISKKDVRLNWVTNLHYFPQTMSLFSTNIKVLTKKHFYVRTSLKSSNWEDVTINSPIILSLYTGSPEDVSHTAFYDGKLILDITYNSIFTDLKEWKNSTNMEGTRTDVLVNTTDELQKAIKIFTKTEI